VPQIVPIEDPADPRIEAYRGVRERDLVGRQGLFVSEGRVVLAMLLASRRYRPLSLLIAQKRVETLAPLLRDVPGDVPVYAAAQPVLDAIAGFPLHRGILALGQRVVTPTPEDLLKTLPRRATILCLSAIANHDNMGGIFRNAAAFGADALLLDADCCDPLYRKAIRVSVGGVLLVPFARLERCEDPLALLTRHKFTAFAFTPSAPRKLAEVRRSERTAILLGAEGPGLAGDLIGRAEAVRIPMSPGFDSLNVATASGIALHHFFG
jgi:tRNA G18 (ribose-2'-O)-methylase SpoU